MEQKKLSIYNVKVVNKDISQDTVLEDFLSAGSVMNCRHQHCYWNTVVSRQILLVACCELAQVFMQHLQVVLLGTRAGWMIGLSFVLQEFGEPFYPLWTMAMEFICTLVPLLLNPSMQIIIAPLASYGMALKRTSVYYMRKLGGSLWQWKENDTAFYFFYRALFGNLPGYRIVFLTRNELGPSKTIMLILIFGNWLLTLSCMNSNIF